jgi:hypothetical protein
VNGCGVALKVDNHPVGWSNLSPALAALGGAEPQLFSRDDFVFIIRNYELETLQNTVPRRYQETA